MITDALAAGKDFARGQLPAGATRTSGRKGRDRRDWAARHRTLQVLRQDASGV